MSYPSEFASKLAYVPLVRNDCVRQFLAECSTVGKGPGPAPIESAFVPIQSLPDLSPELQVIAYDGSRWEAAVEARRNSALLGFIQIGQVRFKLGEFLSLRGRTPVDPLAVASLHSQRRLVDLVLPSARIRWREHGTVRDSFRAAVHEYFRQPLGEGRDPLVNRLYELAAVRPGPLSTGDPQTLRLHRCPSCGEGPLDLRRSPDRQTCPECGSIIYPTDCLRLHEEVQEVESNENVMTRLMTALEHLLIYDHVRQTAERDIRAIASNVWFVDGPLALFGPASWLHAPLQHAYAELNHQLEASDLGPLLLIGVQKTGQLAEHARRIRPQVPVRSFYPLDDQYRYSRVVTSRAPNSAGFGRQSYYGQDFLFRSASGRIHVFSLPYPSATKTDSDFDQIKTDHTQYPQLPVMLAMIERLVSSRHPDALVPTLLAHRVTALSRRPGGRVLELFSRSHIGRRS